MYPTFHAWHFCNEPSFVLAMLQRWHSHTPFIAMAALETDQCFPCLHVDCSDQSDSGMHVLYRCRVSWSKEALQKNMTNEQCRRPRDAFLSPEVKLRFDLSCHSCSLEAREESSPKGKKSVAAPD